MFKLQVLHTFFLNTQNNKKATKAQGVVVWAGGDVDIEHANVLATTITLVSWIL